MPGVAGVVGAVDAAVVLQVEPVGLAGMAGDLVHALAELGVVPVARHELRLDALVGGLPGGPAVASAVDATGRDRRDHRQRVARVREDRVEGLPAVPLAPLGPVRVVPQAALELEGLAAVARAEDRPRLGAGVDHARLGARRELPDAGEGRVGVLGEADRTVGGLLPGLAEVVRTPAPAGRATTTTSPRGCEVGRRWSRPWRSRPPPSGSAVRSTTSPRGCRPTARSTVPCACRPAEPCSSVLLVLDLGRPLTQARPPHPRATHLDPVTNFSPARAARAL